MNYETSINGDLPESDFARQDANTANPLGGDGTNEGRSGKRGWIIATIVLALLTIGAVTAYLVTRQDIEAAKVVAAEKKKAAGQAVTVIAPGSQTVARVINASGTLAARHEIPVGAVGEGGRVLRVLADAGDWVAKGQTLVSIDRAVQTQEGASLSAQIGVARADLQLAENELKRALQLVERGFVSKADVDRRTATRDAAKARVNVAIAQLGAASARTANLDIRAPVSGYVLQRSVEPGQTVGAGSGVLFRIAQGGEMELRAALGEQELAAVSVGISAAVSPVGSDRIFNGNIWQISPIIDAASRQGFARIALPFDKAIRPGGFANVAIKAGATTAPVLPESAVQNDKDGSYVYIVDKSNKAVRRSVNIGEVSASGVTIIDGLDGNERIVLRAAGFLTPGE
nr:efflux RND transporter periplasmic adaptor subunit [Sphingorhabdus sp.]